MGKRKGRDSAKNGHGTVAEKIVTILDQIEHFQQSEYTTIESLPHIEKYLLSVEYIEEFQSFVDEDHFRCVCVCVCVCVSVCACVFKNACVYSCKVLSKFPSLRRHSALAVLNHLRTASQVNAHPICLKCEVFM